MATVNPEWVEAGAARLAEVTRERIVSHGEMVEIVIAAVEPLIRADEREDGTSAKDWARMCREANAAACKAMDKCDHAEAVAARLVEVICEQERTLDLALTHWRDDVRSTRAQIAAEIEAHRDDLAGEYDCAGLAARIARGTP